MADGYGKLSGCLPVSKPITVYNEFIEFTPISGVLDIYQMRSFNLHEGLSDSQVANRLDCSTSAVFTRLKSQEILRGRKGSQTNPEN